MSISVLLPTLNESASLPLVIPAIRQALAGVDLELLVLDDASPDGSADAADRLTSGFGYAARRTGPRGLSHAVIEGFSRAKGDILVGAETDRPGAQGGCRRGILLLHH